MRRQDLFSDTKVGDVMIAHTDRQFRRVHRVTRITAKQIVTDRSRFWRHNRCEVGPWTSTYLHEPEPGEVDEIEAAEAKKLEDQRQFEEDIQRRNADGRYGLLSQIIATAERLELVWERCDADKLQQALDLLAQNEDNER